MIKKDEYLEDNQVSMMEIDFFNWGQKLDFNEVNDFDNKTEEINLFQKNDKDFVFWWLNANESSKDVILEFYNTIINLNNLDNPIMCNKFHLNIIAERLSNIKRKLRGDDSNMITINELNEFFQLMLSGCFSLKDHHPIILAIREAPNYNCTNIWDYLDDKSKAAFTRHLDRWIMYSIFCN